MSEITRGTTPTLPFYFSVIDVSKIVTATMTIKQDDSQIVKKTLETAEVGDDYIQWNLTQEETLLLDEKLYCQIQCKYKLEDGTVSSSRIYNVPASDILDEVVM